LSESLSINNVSSNIFERIYVDQQRFEQHFWANLCRSARFWTTFLSESLSINNVSNNILSESLSFNNVSNNILS
jgi:hypothetical protein